MGSKKLVLLGSFYNKNILATSSFPVNDVENDVVLAFLLLTLNISHNFFCLYCRLKTSVC